MATEKPDRSEPAVGSGPDRPAVLFDGVCNLCNGLVQFLLRRDPEGRLRFGSLQSDAANRLLEGFDLPTDDVESIVVVEGNRAYTKSAAVLRIAKHLGFPYSLLYRFGQLPAGFRDRVYDLVADHRYEVFGKRDRCMVPPPDVEDRFLD
jgi:predicted DCC family thiol-disulfide oxidoreductase YuxK